MINSAVKFFRIFFLVLSPAYFFWQTYVDYKPKTFFWWLELTLGIYASLEIAYRLQAAVLN